MNEAAIDHRRLQRVLFRMFIDASFADAIFDDVLPVVQATGLGATELAWIRRAGRAAIGADKDQKRRGQVLGNVQSEYRSTLAVASVLGHGDRLIDDFAESPEFHDTVMHDGRLPRAFGAYAARRADRMGHAIAGDAVRLERAMVEARRFDAPVAPMPANGWRLSARARTVELADGAFAYIEAMNAALAAGRSPERPPSLGTARETILITAVNAGPHRLREVSAERLEPAVADLIRHAQSGVTAEKAELIAVMHGAEAADVLDFARSLAEDGILDQAHGG